MSDDHSHPAVEDADRAVSEYDALHMVFVVVFIYVFSPGVVTSKVHVWHRFCSALLS